MRPLQYDRIGPEVQAQRGSQAYASLVTQRNLLGLACYCLGSSDKPNLERTDRDTNLQLISRSSDSDWIVYTYVVFSSIFRALCVSC